MDSTKPSLLRRVLAVVVLVLVAAVALGLAVGLVVGLVSAVFWILVVWWRRWSRSCGRGRTLKSARARARA